eukprot:216726-Prymnesium_polylepis.1
MASKNKESNCNNTAGPRFLCVLLLQLKLLSIVRPRPTGVPDICVHPRPVEFLHPSTHAVEDRRELFTPVSWSGGASRAGEPGRERGACGQNRDARQRS